VQGREPWTPRRDEAYIGVLIDDLITRGTEEPYRMFTSRAEYRLLLREDNADLRLTPRGRSLGLVDEARWRRFEAKRNALEAESERLQRLRVSPLGIPEALQTHAFGQPLAREYNATELLRRPDVSYRKLMSLPGLGPGVEDPKIAEQLEVQARYSGYIQRQEEDIARASGDENTVLPKDIEYATVPGLSAEVVQKLADRRPANLGQASRISGVTPAAISLLRIHLKKRRGTAGGI
ncbi:MAG: tRNA uridine-5-carboxymethylaminomethyl(34) synthesis enzyme MnmG, partial [Gammaproteobacteria bacterium]